MREILISLHIALAPLALKAGTATFNFDQDPNAQLEIVGNNPLPWRSTGGNPGGFLAVAYPVNERFTGILFPDIDSGRIVSGFKFEADLRIGNSTGPRAADGFSISFARGEDPLLSDISRTNHFAGAFPEGGSTTGIAVSFDTWAGNRLPDGPDIEGIIVRVDNETVLLESLPTRHGVCHDHTSLQTGPRDESYFLEGGDPFEPGSWENLCWQPFSVELDEASRLTVTYKGNKILDQFQTDYFPSTGRIILAGRTGGANQNTHIDNIKLTTTVQPAPIIDTTVPTISDIGMQTLDAGQFISGLAFTVGDAETAVDELQIAVASSNQTLVPDANVLIGGSGASRSLTIFPVTEQTGQTTVSIVVTDQGNNSATESFILMVQAVDIVSPEISSIADQTTGSGQILSGIIFTVQDNETSVGALRIQASSSNPTLVPDENLLLGGSGEERSLAMIPVVGQSGQAMISITVSDGANLSATRSFILTVLAPDRFPPTVSEIRDQTTEPGKSVQGVVLTVEDAGTDADALSITLSSSNQTLVPDGNLSLGGSGANRILTIIPASGQTGQTSISIVVSDRASNSTSRDFVLTVRSLDTDPPVISAIEDQTIDIGQQISPVAFTVEEAKTAVDALRIEVDSSNETLLPVENLVLVRIGSSMSLTIIPLADRAGQSTITITATDEANNSATTTFLLTVREETKQPDPSSDNNSAVRLLPGAYLAGESLRVTISIVPEPDVLAYSVEESPPTGWVVSEINQGGAFDSINGKVKWGLFFDNQTRELSYTVTPSQTTSGPATFSGSANFNGAINVLITGANEVESTTVTQNTPPTISSISDLAVGLGDVIPVISFIIGDTETAAESLVVRLESSNESLLPASAIVIGGDGTKRTLTLRPVGELVGATTITVTVTDASSNSATQSFNLNVSAQSVPVVEVIYDTTFIAAESATSFGGGRIVAQKFSSGPSAATIRSIAVQLTRTGGVGEPQVEVWTDLKARPSVSIASLNPAQDVQETGVYVFTSNADTVLAAETDYWVIVRGSLDTGLIEQFRWWYLGENAAGTGSGFLRQNTLSDDNGNTWLPPFDGWPNMMRVEVGPVQALRVGVEFNNGLITLSWGSITGHRYQVQTSADLVSWINLGGILTGDGSKLSWRAPASKSSISFYRILRE